MESEAHRDFSAKVRLGEFWNWMLYLKKV